MHSFNEYNNYSAVGRDKKADGNCNEYDTGKTQIYFIDKIYRSSYNDMLFLSLFC